jgi:hypothetical protein
MNKEGFLEKVLLLAPPQQRESVQPQAPPARVRVALEFLRDLTFKTMPKVAINDVAIEDVPLQKLTAEEEAAQDAACFLLSSYFNGRLQLNVQEKSELEQSKRADGPGVVMKCQLCYGGPINPGCALCKGSGNVIVFPAG